jgi:hypothetical protein
MYYVSLFRAGYMISKEPSADVELNVGPFKTSHEAFMWVDANKNKTKVEWN